MGAGSKTANDVAGNNRAEGALVAVVDGTAIAFPAAEAWRVANVQSAGRVGLLSSVSSYLKQEKCRPNNSKTLYLAFYNHYGSRYSSSLD
eukprot:m.212766 g.212766  ORF g.212766 m.212766 type:complete len:90 (-) comp17169_c0_seq1:4693-4962(-)